MGVACKIEIVDLCPFQDSSLLWADVRRKNQKAVSKVLWRQSRPPTVQLINDDADVLVAKVRLHFDKVADGSQACFPSNDSLKAGHELRGRTDLGLRQPFVKSRLVPLKVGRSGWTCHVRSIIMFINNEQVLKMNT